jgi:hypothetical protein
MAFTDIIADRAIELAAAGTSAATSGDGHTGESTETVGARFPLRLLRPAARRLRAPHRIDGMNARHRVVGEEA